ncbi:MAG: hypothetical protein KDA05_04630, partial [Phycisphaerales bacterium]|nr:hypothetical protein [Phycisphaerales bacterium]
MTLSARTAGFAVAALALAAGQALAQFAIKVDATPLEAPTIEIAGVSYPNTAQVTVLLDPGTYTVGYSSPGGPSVAAPFTVTGTGTVSFSPGL